MFEMFAHSETGGLSVSERGAFMVGVGNAVAWTRGFLHGKLVYYVIVPSSRGPRARLDSSP